jgi:anthranilate phosphoribosyltransferase
MKIPLLSVSLCPFQVSRDPAMKNTGTVLVVHGDEGQDVVQMQKFTLITTYYSVCVQCFYALSHAIGFNCGSI